MLQNLPRHTPPLSLMLHDLGDPKPPVLARALGVSTRTVYTWLRRDDAPRPVLLAVFWLTRWGRQHLDADLYNLATLHMRYSAALRRDLSQAHPDVKTAPPLPMAPPLLYVVR